MPSEEVDNTMKQSSESEAELARIRAELQQGNEHSRSKVEVQGNNSFRSHAGADKD